MGGVNGLGFNLETISKGVKIAHSFTSSLFDKSMKMTPIRPDICWADVENQEFIFFDPETFGGPKCKNNQTIYKDESNVLFVEGIMERDLVITNNHIWIFWET